MAKRFSKQDKVIGGMILLGLAVWAIFTVLFWFCVCLSVFCMLAIGNYLTKNVYWIQERFWVQITIWVFIVVAILIGGSQILANYGKINQSFISIAKETTSDFYLNKSKQ